MKINEIIFIRTKLQKSREMPAICMRAVHLAYLKRIQRLLRVYAYRINRMHVRIRTKFQLSMLKCFCLAGVPAYATVCDRA